MASVLTSMYPEAHGVRSTNDVLAASLVLLPEILKANGYETCCIHGNPWMQEKFGFKQGFDAFEYGNFWEGTMGANQLNKLATKWLVRERDAPYFAYLHYMDTHFPYDPPRDCRLFGTDMVGMYDGDIVFTDRQLRSLLCALEEKGLLNNTCIILTADHGEEFFEHGGIRHGMTLYNEVLRVPLIFYYPEFIRKGRRVARHVSLMDIAPTVLDLAGIAVPPDMDGVSLMDDLRGSPFRTRAGRSAFSQVGLNDLAPNKDLVAVTTPEYKYIFDRLSSNEELYVLADDPAERNDVSRTMPDVAAQFRDMVREFYELQAARKPIATGKAKIDPESARRLKSLGYLR